MKKFLLLISWTLSVQFVLAQIPQTMSYQGVLSDAGGNPVTNGDYTLTFRLYDVPTSGDPLWIETQTATVTSGLFSTTLGSQRPLNLPFDKPYWLGTTVGDGSELVPRIALTASPYSLNSHSTITEPEPGQGLTIRDESGVATHQLSADGNVTHSGVGTFLGGIVVGDTIIAPIDTSGETSSGAAILSEAANNKVAVNLPAVGIQGYGNDIGAYGVVPEAGTGVWGQSKSGTGVFGISETGTGVSGRSKGGLAVGVYGESEGFHGIFGESKAHSGVHGLSHGANGAGVSAFNAGGGAGVVATGNPALYAKGVVKIDVVPLAFEQNRFLVWDTDNIVKYRTMAFNGVLQNTALSILNADGIEVFRVNPDGTSFHRGKEEFASGINATGSFVSNGDNIFYNAGPGQSNSPESKNLAGGPEQNVLYFGQDLTGANTAALFGKVTGERAAIYGEKAAPGVSSIQSTGGDMLRERFETLRREVASAQSGIPSDLPQLRLQTHQPVLWGTTSLSDVVSVFGQITNTTSNFPAIWGFHSGVGSAVNGQISNASSTAPAVWGVSNGTGSGVASTMTGNGSGLLVDHNGSSGNLALFRSGNANQVRIDKTGKGFFNGGTQTGGADVAEAFEVEGFVDEYEPGDVMVISTDNDRTMEKSREPYSTLVAGVYATKPGVLLTERNVDDPHDDTVPLGVIGVIPTKVSGENGPIRRGDLLVTANLPGHAMKGTDRERLVGAVLGKALENFDGSVGVIRVLVNTK